MPELPVQPFVLNFYMICMICMICVIHYFKLAFSLLIYLLSFMQLQFEMIVMKII